MWPSQNTKNDKAIGIRFDWGALQTHPDGRIERHFDLQCNKEAEIKALRDLAKGDSSHDKRVRFSYEINPQSRSPVLKDDALWAAFVEEFIAEAEKWGI